MKNRNLITKYLIVILPLLFMSLNAQDDVDPVEAASQAKAVAEAAVEEVATPEGEESATEEAATTPEGEESATGEAGEAAPAEATFDTLAAVDEGEFDSLDVETGPLAGFSMGVAPSIGLVSGATFTNVPVGATVVITTPYGFDLGPLNFTISLAFGGYNGNYDSKEAGDADPPGGHYVTTFNPTVIGVGGNLTLANFVFAEGHAGIVGEGTGIRGFAGVSLEYLMKKGLNLPVNILVGGEGFISTNMAGADNMSGWGGLGVRLDYDF